MPQPAPEIAEEVLGEDFERQPILTRPQDEPTFHWGTGQAKTSGRRSALNLAAGPAPDPSGSLFEDDEGAVERVRGEVGKWRRAGWEGASPGTRRLLACWSRDPDENNGRSLFFAQREALETIAYLTEIVDENHWMLEQLRGFAENYSRGVMRLGIRIATGGGKTRVMAGLCLYYAANRRGRGRQTAGSLARRVDRIVVICPGRTIRAQLEGLNPQHGKASVYAEMADEQAIRDLSKVRVHVVNYEQLVPKKNAAFGGMEVKGLGRKELAALAGEADEEETSETWPEVWRRVLGLTPGRHGQERIVVVNDEGHHCWERKDGESPGVWMEAIHGLAALDRVDVRQVVDLSATPRFINPAKTRSTQGSGVPEIFPWVVSEFGLEEAQEAGLVKIPQRPRETRNLPEELLENLYEANTPKRLRTNGRTDPKAMRLVAEACDALYADYEREFDRWGGEEEDPVFIAVVNNKQNARAIFDELAGDPEGPEGGGKTLFANTPNGAMRSILVHSKTDQPETEENARVEGGWLGRRQVGKAGGPSEDDLRETLRTVGRAGTPGGTVRCVVSVGMLTEGWDCRQVTHIIGYRRFGSALLAEQTVGRALRRSDYERTVPVQPQDGGPIERRYPAQYAAVFGVPIPSIGKNREPVEPPEPPKKTWVAPVPGRCDTMKIEWPRIEGYRMTGETPEVALDETKVKAWEPEIEDRGEERIVRIRGLIGKTRTIALENEPQDHWLWELAAEVAEFIQADGGGAQDARRRSAVVFAQTLAAAKAWAAHPKVRTAKASCRDPNLRRAAAEDVFAALTIGGMPGRRIGIGDGREGAPLTGCAGEWKPFRTSLKHIVEMDRSELDNAACHSLLEAQVCVAMQEIPEAVSIARNHGPEALEIPYRKPVGGWARYVPDFIVRMQEEDGMAPHLLVEVKGVRDEDADVKEAWTRGWWTPAANDWGEERGQRWDYVMVEKADQTTSRIAEAVRSMRSQT